MKKSLFWEDIWEVFLNIEKRKINENFSKDIEKPGRQKNKI